MKQIALVSYAGCPDLTDDDRLLIPALGRLGAEGVPVVWDAPVSWIDFDGIILRSCWDYHLRCPEFLKWIAHLAVLDAPLQNSANLVRWNSDKRYLRELEDAGARIPPTVWIDDDEEIEVQAVLKANGWHCAVVKPTVSASAHQLQRVFVDEPPIRAKGPAMVQPFMPEVVNSGEWSLIFIGGEYSHAVLKVAAEGDFRVQWNFGGTAKPAEPNSRSLDSARKIISGLSETPLYARVDGIAENGEFVLMELELIEPELFLRWGGAADRFASSAMSLIDAKFKISGVV